MKKSNFILLIFFLPLILFSPEASSQSNSSSLRNLDDELVKLNDFLGKGPVILDFWATWCKPCVKSLPKMQKLYEKYEKQGLIILAINEDGPQSIAKVEPFVNSLGLTFPVLLDNNRDLVRRFQVSGLPTTIIFDKNKKIIHTIRGYRPGDEEKLEQRIISLLKAD